MGMFVWDSAFAGRFVTFCALIVKSQHSISTAIFIAGMINRVEVGQLVIPTEWTYNRRLKAEAQTDTAQRLRYGR